MDSQAYERKSSAVTLSDMEVFIFPDLIYSLVLANIMSPRIWKWREDPWFAGLERMKPYRRITRLKQYIMDHYVFNLDLDTWGLTDKQTELRRFAPFIDAETLAQSNALFGYEGDRYYFDIDIRTHFGLDKYEGDIIPYWKTETVEAMDAFCHRPNYGTGAGECVSLATLYAAALFIVAGIPLRDIYLMATPLHSQNFVDVNDGILTNNRRLVTRNMWFNGTALSAQARRALENERVTVVAHESGCIHTIYEEASMDPGAYRIFREKLSAYLKTTLNSELLGNFIRHDRGIQKCFQMRWQLHGVDHYIPIERLMEYEHGGPYLITDNTRDKLMADVDDEEFCPDPLPGRIILNDLEAFVTEHEIDIHKAEDARKLRAAFSSNCLNADLALASLKKFCHVEPRLPDAGRKQFVRTHAPLGLHTDMERADVIARLEDLRATNPMAGLAFYAYRDLNRTEPGPFLKAALERNPVSLQATQAMNEADAAAAVRALAEHSIYDDDGRLAQPDEVWNYGRGDGAEKAVLLANILHRRHPDREVVIRVRPDGADLEVDGRTHTFSSSKRLNEAVWTFRS
jgi:xanthine/CO dehydrogenase XdhC/CoxF family maturation factor